MAEINNFILKKIIPVIEQTDCRTICDYGCGDGKLLEKLNELNSDLELTGIDYFNRFCDNDPRKNDSPVAHYVDRESDEYQQLVDSSGFDLLLSTFALHHFQSPISELQAMVSMVKPGCQLIFIDYAFQNRNPAEVTKNISSFIQEMSMAIRKFHHRHHYTLDEALDLMKAVPVEVDEAVELTNEETATERKENVVDSLEQNALTHASIQKNASDFWKTIWPPFWELEESFIKEHGLDYSLLVYLSVKRVQDGLPQ